MLSNAEKISQILEQFNEEPGLIQLKKLFWKELNFNRINEPLSTRDWTDKARDLIIDDPILFATAGINEGFHVIYCHLNSHKLHITPERTLINKLLVNYPYTLFIFSNAEQSIWHLVNVKYGEDPKKRKLFRRITIGPGEKYRTASERISMLDTETEELSADAFTIQARHDEAFDVEKVTEKFFEEYKALFDEIKKYLMDKSSDKHWSHDYTLQFLNRIMFIYFIQRKGWMGNDPDFLFEFWKSYKKSNQPENSFYEKWLSILLFQTFNGHKYDERSKHFPDNIKKILDLAPYLNGGLFTENKLDDIGNNQNIKIEDKCFKTIFEFFNHYNFTISEDSPFDQEVAVDPEMIGKVYESLVNVSEEIDERGEAGIFYTPRIEIDLMCKLSLVDFLSNHLDENHKSLLYEFILAFDEEEKENADKQISDNNLWKKIDVLLREITVVDPACGSGSFPVGMLQILDALFIRIDAALNRHSESSYDRKKRIIGNSLYGVDVMNWAVDVAELRLWLQLIIETEIPLAQRQLFPLLPNLSFKIRQGDSLVQEIGGVDFGHYKKYTAIDSSLKIKVTNFKKAKYDYFQNVQGRRYHSEEDVKQQERNIFLEILRNQKIRKQKDIEKLNEDKAEKRPDKSFDFIDDSPTQVEWTDDKIDKEIALIKKEIELIETDIDELKKNVKSMPFVWNISFVEIFSGDKHGFDIVIGNPPYVRQEKIADPLKDPDNYGGEKSADWKKQKKIYKDNLKRSVYMEFSKYFNYKEHKDTSAIALNAKNDLYIYFYFHGLRLLNEKGSFCFITSNSWLDVGYGKDLQEFLLKHSHVKFIIDNQVKRSFKSASINTIIALFSKPDDNSLVGFNHTARFVMFKTEFENTISSVLWEEIEEATERIPTPEYRVFPINQRELWQDGLEQPDSKDKLADNPYIGNKWGGKYLRAPEIYWTIIERNKNKFLKLASISNLIQRNNLENFKKWEIIKIPFQDEHNYFPFLHSLKNTKSIKIKVNTLKSFRKTKKNKSINYIIPDIISNRFIGDRFLFLKGGDFLVNDSFFIAKLKQNVDKDSILAYLNSTFSLFCLEIIGRKTYGIGVMYIYGPEFSNSLIIKPEFIELSKDLYKNLFLREIQSIFTECGFDKEKPVREQEPNPLPDRKALDDIVFDALGLTAEERKEVYWAVCELVQNRLNKAKSV